MKTKHRISSVALAIVVLAFPLLASAMATAYGNGAGGTEVPQDVSASFPTLPKAWDNLNPKLFREKLGKQTPKTPEEARHRTILLGVSEAHELIKQNQDSQALAKLNELEPVAGKTPDETYLIERTKLAIALRTHDKPLLLQTAQAVLATGQEVPEEKVPLEDLLGRNYYNAQNYPQAIVWLKRYLQDGGSDANLKNALTAAYYFTKDDTQAIAQAKAVIAAQEQAGQAPPESLIKIWISAASRQHNPKEHTEALEKAVVYYPKKEYWAELLDRVISNPAFAESLSYDVYRLMDATGQITGEQDYVDMAQAAIQAGYAEQAKRILERGYASGVLGHGADAGMHKRLLETATRSAATEAKDLDKEGASVARDKTGERMVNIGYRYIDHGRVEQGIGMMEKGIALGGLKQPEQAQLHLGVAYALAGRKEDALRTLQGVEGRNGTADLAKYWSLLLDSEAPKLGLMTFAGHVFV